MKFAAILLLIATPATAQVFEYRSPLPEIAPEQFRPLPGVPLNDPSGQPYQDWLDQRPAYDAALIEHQQTAARRADAEAHSAAVARGVLLAILARQPQPVPAQTLPTVKPVPED